MNYEYFCQNCQTEFSISIAVKDLIGAMFCCPNCHGYNIKRKFYPIPTIYKGEGFTKKVQEENKK